jgi:FAD/FMN-containing dehydrogenase
VLAHSSSQARNLWQIREATGEFPVRLQPINFDVSLPISRIGQYVQTCREALSARWPTHRTVFFGHIGDGNLHLTVDARTLGPDVDEVEVELLVYRLLQAEDGSISAEHGIGLLKKQFLHFSRTSTEIALMRALKDFLDPRGTLNPGKIF